MDMTPEDFREAADLAADWVAAYREGIEDHPVLSRVDPGDVAARIDEEPPEQGEPFEAILRDMEETVVPGLTHWNHPGFFAYFPSNASGPAVLAEFVAAALNQNAMLWRTSPAATEMEERMVGWIRRLVGLPDDFTGVLQDTASSSSFTALLGARERLGAEIRRRGMAGRADLPSLLLYVSEQAHSSLEKAAIAAGLGQDGVQKVLADPSYRMDPEALDERIREDREAGRAPVMVCATVGTTSTASVDPVDAIADVCEEHGVWLHVDAAYAGPAAMLPEMRERFSGWERADSVVLNPHKWMATPVDCSVLLFRDPATVRASLALTPEYLRSEEDGEEERTNLMDYGLPLGRRFRALKLWFLLRWYGAEGLRELLRGHIRWAHAFADGVREDDRFELVAEPSFSTVCFRALPQEPTGPEEDAGDARPLAGEEARDALAVNDLNRRLLEDVNRQGDVFLSHTELAGRYVLRLSVGGPFTRQEHVREAWRRLAEAYEARSGEA